MDDEFNADALVDHRLMTTANRILTTIISLRLPKGSPPILNQVQFLAREKKRVIDLLRLLFEKLTDLRKDKVDFLKNRAAETVSADLNESALREFIESSDRAQTLLTFIEDYKRGVYELDESDPSVHVSLTVLPVPPHSDEYSTVQTRAELVAQFRSYRFLTNVRAVNQSLDRLTADEAMRLFGEIEAQPRAVMRLPK